MVVSSLVLSANVIEDSSMFMAFKKITALTSLTYSDITSTSNTFTTTVCVFCFSELTLVTSLSIEGFALTDGEVQNSSVFRVLLPELT